MIASLLIFVALAGPQTAPPNPVTVTKIATPQKSLRFEVIVPASVDEVWNALTTREGTSTWLWRDTQVDLKVGGDWLVLFPGGATAGGTILAVEPKRKLTMSAMAPEQFPTVRKERTTAVFALEPVTASSTKVTLLQTGWKDGQEWDAAYEYLAGGNAQLLQQLHHRFTSGPIDWSKIK